MPDPMWQKSNTDTAEPNLAAAPRTENDEPRHVKSRIEAVAPTVTLL
jgi:hypothetical protein